MFLCYDIIQDVPRLRSLSLSLAISTNLSSFYFTETLYEA